MCHAGLATGSEAPGHVSTMHACVFRNSVPGLLPRRLDVCRGCCVCAAAFDGDSGFCVGMCTDGVRLSSGLTPSLAGWLWARMRKRRQCVAAGAYSLGTFVPWAV
jgi:hypothetical protein